MLIGLALFLLPALLVPQRNFGYRLTRLPGAVFASFGAMQFYSAALGFCTQVWGRDSRQVRPWELDEAEPVKAPASALPVPKGHVPVHDLPATDSEKPVGHASADGDADADADADARTLNRKESEATLAEIHSKQLAIRRATIKVPPAELAFPIAEADADADADTDEWKSIAATSPDPASLAERHEISPWAAFSDEWSWSSTAPVAVAASPSPAAPTAGLGVAHVQTERPTKQPTDLDGLVNRWDAADPVRTEAWEASAPAREKRTKMFGPERVIQDPAVKAAHARVVRDILILGGAVGVVMVVLCFAAPMRL
jgi:hypothetical protein